MFIVVFILSLDAVAIERNFITGYTQSAMYSAILSAIVFIISREIFRRMKKN